MKTKKKYRTLKMYQTALKKIYSLMPVCSLACLLNCSAICDVTVPITHTDNSLSVSVFDFGNAHLFYLWRGEWWGVFLENYLET